MFLSEQVSSLAPDGSLVVIEGSQQVLHQVRQIAADEQAVLALRHWQRLPTQFE